MQSRISFTQNIMPVGENVPRKLSWQFKVLGGINLAPSSRLSREALRVGAGKDTFILTVSKAWAGFPYGKS